MLRSKGYSFDSGKESAGKKAAETRRRRRLERETRDWLGRLGLLMDSPPDDVIFWSVSTEIKDGDIEAALEQAIAQVCRAMRPLTPLEIFSDVLDGLEDPRPLECDVTITHGGKALALIQASAAGPIVTRFRAKDPGRAADPC